VRKSTSNLLLLWDILESTSQSITFYPEICRETVPYLFLRVVFDQCKASISLDRLRPCSSHSIIIFTLFVSAHFRSFPPPPLRFSSEPAATTIIKLIGLSVTTLDPCPTPCARWQRTLPRCYFSSSAAIRCNPQINQHSPSSTMKRPMCR